MMGLKVVEIDYAIDSVSEVREALSLSQCRCLYFAPSFEGTDKLLLLRKSIPEFYECEFEFCIFVVVRIFIYVYV